MSREDFRNLDRIETIGKFILQVSNLLNKSKNLGGQELFISFINEDRKYIVQHCVDWINKKRP